MFDFRLTPVLADGQKKPDDSLAGGIGALVAAVRKEEVKVHVDLTKIQAGVLAIARMLCVRVYRLVCRPSNWIHCQR